MYDAEMDLLEYIKKQPRGSREVIAKACGTTAGHLNNVAYKIKAASPALALAIEEHSGGQVTRKEMREDWYSIWPDLRGDVNPHAYGAHAGAAR